MENLPTRIAGIYIYRVFLNFLVFALLFISTALEARQGIENKVVKNIIKRGEVVCGVSMGLPGFSMETTPGSGDYRGFDVDYCKAIAAAMFGDPMRVRFVPLTGGQRFLALLNEDIDVLIRNTTHTLRRDANLPDLGVGLQFAPTTFYDGQGLLTDIPTPDIDNIPDLLNFLTDKTICVTESTTTEQNLNTLLEAGASFTITLVNGSAISEYDYNNDCDIVSSDKSSLMSSGRSGLIFSITLSKEPLGPVTIYGDQLWGDIVDWVVYATFFAEERGITQLNADNACETGSVEDQIFLGCVGNLGETLGLSNDWGKQVIKAVGNYAEIYERNLLPSLIRDQKNQSYINGGLHYAPLFR